MELALPSRRGLRPRARQIDRDLWLWFCRARHCHEHEGGPRVSKRVVQEEAKRVFHCAGITTFKASDGWYWRWLHRWRGLDPNSTSDKDTRDTEKVENKTAEKMLPKTVSTGKYRYPSFEVTLSSTMESPSPPSTKDTQHQHPSIRLQPIDCGGVGGERVDPRLQDANQALCESNANATGTGAGADFWSDYVANESASQDMLAMTDNSFYHENNLHPCQGVEPHSIQIGNNQQNNLVDSLNLDGQMLQIERLSDLNAPFNNQNTISGKFMSYDIHLSNDQVCLLNDDLTMQVLDSTQQILPLHETEYYFDPEPIDVPAQQQTDLNPFCNTAIANSNGLQQLDSVNQSYLSEPCESSASQNLLSCSAIEDLNPTLQSSKEVYDVIASMTSTLLSSSPGLGLSDDFCMENEASFFGSKNQNEFRNCLEIDSLDDIGCRDIDSRTDTTLMDVVLDPLQSDGDGETDGQQYHGSCDSGIDLSPLASKEPPTATDFNLPPTQNPFDPDLCLDLGTDPGTMTGTDSPLDRDDDCDIFLNLNSDDSVAITDLISLGDTDDCINDDDSLPEDYLEFIDNYKDRCSSLETINEATTSPDKTTEKAQKTGTGNDTCTVAKTRRTGGERYLPYFKQRVLKYAAAHTFKEAAERFHVNVDSITLWALKSRQGVVKQNPEKHLLIWLRKCREMGYSITRDQLRAKVEQLLNAGSGLPKREQNGWFYVWAKRIVNVDEGSGEDAKEKPAKALYPPAFKTEVALLAETTSKHNASLVFSVARKRVYEWLAGLRDITEVVCGKNEEIDEPVKISTENTGVSPTQSKSVVKQKTRKPVTSSEIDKQLLKWFRESMATTGRPTASEVRSRAVALFRSHGHNGINCSHGWYRRWCTRHGLDMRHPGDDEVLAWCLQQLDKGRNISQRALLAAAHSILSGKHKSQFKASAGWARRFAWRHGALLSEWPQIGGESQLPTLLTNRAAAFRTQVQNTIKEHGLSADVIGTMDEVPLSLTASGSSGRGTSLLNRPWPESVHATVILGCLADGELLPPAVVLKGEGDGEPESIAVGKTRVLVFRQQGAAVDENVLLQWLQLVWFSSRVGDIGGLLVVDSGEAHGSARVGVALAARRCRLALIPAGCGALLLPLASAALRTFRAALEQGAEPEPRAGAVCVPLLTTVAERVARAHAALAAKKEMLRTSFQSTGLTGAENCKENLIGNSSM